MGNDNVEVLEEIPEQPKEDVVLMNDNKEKKKGHKGLIIILIVLIAVIILGILGYVLYFGNSKRIVSKSITELSKKTDTLFDKGKEASKVGDTYTLTSDIKLKVESDYLQSLGTSEEYKPYVNLLNNLEKLNNKLVIEQDMENKKILAAFSSSYNNEYLINAKYLIENNKGYYFVQNLLNTYVENGENKYFDTSNSNKETIENMQYVYETAVKSLQNNLKDNYFVKKSVKTTINGKEKDVTRVTLKINDKVAKELASNILKDLQNDKKASKILNDIDPSFAKAKVTDNDNKMDYSEIDYNVYVDKLTYKIYKYELLLKDEKESYAITYEDSNIDTLEIYNNNELLGKATINKKDDNTNIAIYDAKNNKISDIEYTKKNDKVTTIANVDVDGVKCTLTLDSITKEVTKNEEYKEDSVISLEVSQSGSNLLKATINVSSKLAKGAKINEDVSTAVKEDTITDDISNNFTTQLTGVLMKLMS